MITLIAAGLGLAIIGAVGWRRQRRCRCQRERPLACLDALRHVTDGAREWQQVRTIASSTSSTVRRSSPRPPPDH